MLMKLNLRAIKQEAAAEAELMLPKHYACREDLVCNTPTDLISRGDGTRSAGTVSVNDIFPGSLSPAIWAYYPTMTLLAVITFIVGVSAAYLGAWIPLSSIAEAWHQGSGVLGSLLYALKITAVGWLLWGMLPAIGVAVQMYYWFLVFCEQEPSRDFHRVWLLATTLIVVGCVAMPFVGPLGCAVTSLFSIIGFQLYVGLHEKSRDDVLREITADTRLATVLKGREVQEEARKVQAANSVKDTSNLMPIGITNETLRADGDAMTGDPDTWLCLTVEDLKDVHILLRGKSGAGKTNRFIKPFTKNVIAATWDRQNNRSTWALPSLTVPRTSPKTFARCLTML